MNRCTGRCGRSLPPYMFTCDDCTRRDDAFVASAVKRACPDCNGTGHRIGINSRGYEIIDIDHEHTCPHQLTGGA